MKRAVFILRPVSDVGLGVCTSGVGEVDCFFFYSRHCLMREMFTAFFRYLLTTITQTPPEGAGNA